MRVQESKVANVMIRTVQKSTVLALLIEANGLVRLKLKRALEQEHFELLWTATTQEAVAAYNRGHIDLLLLDLNQSLKVGWDIFEPVGALNPALPIVMVTEKKTELEQTVAERVGARLEKPFTLPALLQSIHLLLTQTHLQATGSARISNHSASKPTGAAEPGRKPKGSKRMKQKLLLVDDDKESLRRSLRHSLSSETYEVVLAENVQHAIAKSQASEIDLLLMNLDSPTEEEGWEAIEQSQKRIRSCPSLCITKQSELKELSEAAGARALVEEPGDGQATVTKVTAGGPRE